VPQGTPRNTAHRQAGFTILELTVALVVLLVAVLMACDLLDESARLLHHSVRRARDPWTLLTTELLRNDLRGGTPLPAGPGVGPPLQLITDEGLVTWELGPRDELLRGVSGGPVRTLLRGVSGWQWRLLPGPAVEVELRLHLSSPYLRQAGGRLPRADPGEDITLHWLVVTRGGASSARW
jgi:prepilin-type N-terminal cleavage/methylation domain-containing protein